MAYKCAITSPLTAARFGKSKLIRGLLGVFIWCQFKFRPRFCEQIPHIEVFRDFS